MQDKEQHLVSLFRRLPAEQAHALLEFAEFLLSRSPQTVNAVDSAAIAEPVRTPADSTEEVQKLNQPVELPRPETESVIAAVKRLSATYPMLSKDKMLHETADLVSQSLLGGRDTVEVIDELEAIFLKQYEQYTENTST